MSKDYSSDTKTNSGTPRPNKPGRSWWMLLVLPGWVLACFFLAQIIIASLFLVIDSLNIPIEITNTAILNTIASAAIYAITIPLVTILPIKFVRIRTSWEEIGLSRLPSWMDIIITPAGIITYFVLSATLILVATQVLPGFDIDQVQDVGFDHLALRYEYVLAFISLVIVAPFAEEILFRGYLFGKLKEYVPVWVAVIATSLLFGVLHGNWNVVIDTFALSIVLCILRELTGNIWASVLLHMVKNGVAFYILFIYPSLLTTLVK